MALATVFVSVLFLTACPMQDPHSTTPVAPRFTKLDAFDPHRKEFVCKHEADANPPPTAEAEALFQQGMAATSHGLWPEDRDYPKAAQLWTQAAQQGHWKAQFNLAGLYLQGMGVPQDADKALELTEDLMRKGVPAAWDNMGAYYMGGVGPLQQDATVAYAFWQKAADMGSMAAQAHLGEKLNAGYDDPPSFWGNEAIGLKMLECAFSQGSGNAAYEIGLTQNRDAKQPEDYSRALAVFHEGVKFGHEKAANSLSVAFDSGRALVDRRIDVARAERYSVLGDALWHNPDLRFPNLDKVLPLPPADLPYWNGDKKTLIDAAKALVPAPVIKPTPGSERTGRAHIPDGHVLPANPAPPPIEMVGGGQVIPQYESTLARFTGYWLPQLLEARDAHHLQWDRAQVPQRYARGEAFEQNREGLSPHDGRVMWHYVGVPARRAAQASDPRVAQGVARTTRLPAPRQTCTGSATCPRTGVWFGHIKDDLPLAATFNRWDRQAYVRTGQPFPDPRELNLDIAASDVIWLWLDNANQPGESGMVEVTLSDLHDAQGVVSHG